MRRGAVELAVHHHAISSSSLCQSTYVFTCALITAHLCNPSCCESQPSTNGMVPCPPRPIAWSTARLASGQQAGHPSASLPYPLLAAGARGAPSAKLTPKLSQARGGGPLQPTCPRSGHCLEACAVLCWCMPAGCMPAETEHLQTRQTKVLHRLQPRTQFNN